MIGKVKWPQNYSALNPTKQVKYSKPDCIYQLYGVNKLYLKSISGGSTSILGAVLQPFLPGDVRQC